MQALMSSLVFKYQKYSAGLLKVCETPPENWTYPRMGFSLKRDHALIASKAADDDEDIILVVRNIIPFHFIRIARYDDIAVALEIDQNDEPTVVEIECGGRTISTLRLLPGKPTLIIEDTYPMILTALSYHDVTIQFKGPIPQKLKFIGAQILKENTDKTLRETLIYHTFPSQVFIIEQGLGYIQSISAAEVAELTKHVYHIPKFYN